MNVSLASSREFDRNGRAHSSVLQSSAIKVLIAVLIAIGLLARVSPFFDIDDRLFWQYMTEDGYLMQTIARNMAIGLGMTTAEGTMATNGVQPLATYIFTGLHYLTGGSKLGGVVLVSLASILFSMLAAYCLFRVMALVMRKLPYGADLARVSAALWFAAPLIVPISMNGLETSLYWAVLLGTLWYFFAATSDFYSLRWSQRLVLGTLLGLTFLSRNDAAFFIGIVLLVHLIFGGTTEGGGYRRRFNDCLVAGLASIAVASPWLIYNYRLFGSIVPISGTAQSFSTALGSNLPLIPAKLFEASTLFLPLPGTFERTIPTILIALALVAFNFFVFWSDLGKIDATARRFIAIATGLTICLSGYYGIMFGAPHFLARYLSILSPFLWTTTAVTLMVLLARILKAETRVSYAAASIVGVLAIAAAVFAGTTFARGYSPGTAHMHKQVAEWVVANVPKTSWVGAPQTGVVGYFHDRTLNLDGKVNPQALRVLLDEEHILNYVLASKVDYIVDWVGMAEWVTFDHLSPRFGREFVVVVKDQEHNLAVLKRIHPRDE